MYTSLAIMGDQMLRGINARSQLNQKEIADAVHKAMEAMMQQSAATAARAAGREVAMNPISLAAAAFEVEERIEKKPTNPLQAALDGDEVAFDSMVIEDDDDKDDLKFN